MLRRYPKQVLLADRRAGRRRRRVLHLRAVHHHLRGHLPRAAAEYALNAVLIAAAVQVVLIPFFGILSDRFARRPVYLAGAIGAAVWVFVVLRPARHRPVRR